MLCVDRTVIDGESAATRSAVYRNWLPESTETDGALTVAEAAAAVAQTRRLSAAEIAAESKESLITAMAVCRLDVQSLATELEKTATELQQKLRGEKPMTLQEYATIEAAIATHR